MRYDEVVEAVNKVMREYTMRLTIRQLYYRIISPPYQLFANTMNNYKAFDKVMTKARERGHVDWRRIEDRARGTIGGDYGWASPDAYLDEKIDELKNAADHYTRAIWDNQPQYVEVWVEKDALATLFSQAVGGFRVVTFPSRGYSSFTKVMEAIIERFMERWKRGQQVIILHFSDHDPSGLNMSQDLFNRLRDYGVQAISDEGGDEGIDAENKFSHERPYFEIVRCALTYDQVQQFQLASNPTKSADPRSKDYVAKYGDKCWELDAVPPDSLQEIIRRSVWQFIDADLWKQTRETMEKEQQQLREKLVRLKITFDEE